MKNSSLNVSEFSSGLVSFKLGKKNKLSEFFSARFLDSHFYVKKKSTLWISPKFIQNKRKPLFSSMWLNSGEIQF